MIHRKEWLHYLVWRVKKWWRERSATRFSQG
jgi:hypothetical protein